MDEVHSLDNIYCETQPQSLLIDDKDIVNLHDGVKVGANLIAPFQDWA